MPVKLKERVQTIIVKPFDYMVKVIVSNDIHQSAAKRLRITLEETTHACHCGVTNNLLSFIFLPKGASAGTVAHEVFHCTWHIMRQIGAELENEVMAYTLTYLVNEISQFMSGKKTKSKRKKGRPGSSSLVGGLR